VLLVTSADLLTVIGSDGETSISASAPSTVSAQGQVLVPPRPIGAYLTTIDPTAPVSLDAVSEVEMELKVGDGAPYRFRRLSAAFPLPSVPKSPQHTLDFSRLPAALSAVRTSMSKESPVVQLVSGSFGLRLHTTDNYRLTRVELPEAGLGTDLTAVVSPAVLERAARANINAVQVDPAGRSIRFLGDNVAIATRFLTFAFPSVDATVERGHDHTCQLPTAELRLALARLSAVAETSPLTVRLEHDEMILSVENVQLGSGVERLKLPGSLDAPFQFAAMLSYLADALAGIGKAEVTLSWTNADEAIYLESRSPLPVTCVVMPMRI
jgi:DNA polymerase III sliding clamp (beta) subunit (PCNA family)